ncbi:hypothetical protein PMAYCL1PPCAC_30180, partial [Pristionchus mayeri]
TLPLVTGYWANLPADMQYKFYLWNITNSDEVLFEGALPRLLDHGPYVYDCKESKENLTWSRNGSQVSYRTRRIWMFNSLLSCSTCTEQDRFFVPNVAYAGISSITGVPSFPSTISTLLD